VADYPFDMATIDISKTPVASMVQPTGRLRWRNGVLEQEFHVRHFNPNGVVSHLSTDWRQVPTEE